MFSAPQPVIMMASWSTGISEKQKQKQKQKQGEKKDKNKENFNKTRKGEIRANKKKIRKANYSWLLLAYAAENKNTKGNPFGGKFKSKPKLKLSSFSSV